MINHNYYGDVLLLTCTDEKVVKRYAAAPLDITEEEFNKIGFLKEPVIESKHIIGFYSIQMPNGQLAHRGFDCTAGTVHNDVEVSMLGYNRIQLAINQELENEMLVDIFIEAENMGFV